MKFSDDRKLEVNTNTEVVQNIQQKELDGLRNGLKYGGSSIYLFKKKSAIKWDFSTSKDPKSKKLTFRAITERLGEGEG